MRPPNVSNGFIVDMKKVGFVKFLFHAIILNTLLEQALRPHLVAVTPSGVAKVYTFIA